MRSKQNIVNVECVIRKENKYLMIQRAAGKKHAPGVLAFPGGKIERNDPTKDTLESGLKREVLEEVGLIIDGPLRYLHSTSFFTEEQNFVINIVFYYTFKKNIPLIKHRPEEIDHWYWMTEEEVRSHPLKPNWLDHTFDELARI